MAIVNGTPGNDVFKNAASNDLYLGLNGNDTLKFGFGSGQDGFLGNGGTNTLQLTVPLFDVLYIQDTFID